MTCRYTRNSAIADKPRDVFRGQSRSPNMVPFDMLGMVSYYCATVTLSLAEPGAGSGVVRIDQLRFLAGCRYKATKPGLVSVLYLSMRYTVLLFIRARFYVFDLYVYRDLETWVRGHSRSSEPTRIDLPPMTSY